MQNKESNVRSKRDIVGVAQYAVYDSLKEAIEALGEETILNLANVQVKTNAMNTVRAKVTGKVSGKVLDQMAMLECTGPELAKVAGDLVGLQVLLDKHKTKVIARLESEKAAAIADLADAGEEEEEEED